MTAIHVHSRINYRVWKIEQRYSSLFVWMCVTVKVSFTVLRVGVILGQGCTPRINPHRCCEHACCPSHVSIHESRNCIILCYYFSWLLHTIHTSYVCVCWYPFMNRTYMIRQALWVVVHLFYLMTVLMMLIPVIIFIVFILQLSVWNVHANINLNLTK